MASCPARALCGGSPGSRPVGARRNDAGSCRIRLPTGVSFTPEVFLNAAERLSCARRFVSLVPTQVHKLLEAAEANPTMGSEIYDALGQFTGILLGGAQASASLLTARASSG